MHINIVAHASLSVYYILLLKFRFTHNNNICLDKSQMGIYIYLNFSYNFIKNSHFGQRSNGQIFT